MVKQEFSYNGDTEEARFVRYGVEFIIEKISFAKAQEFGKLFTRLEEHMKRVVTNQVADKIYDLSDKIRDLADEL